MYHTQEKRPVLLTSPAKCERADAWLGHGYYFWHDIRDAHHWGSTNKLKPTKAYSIFKATIDCENVLNVAYNEKHEQYWEETIDFARQEMSKKIFNKRDILVGDIFPYLEEKFSWYSKFDGILFHDLPDGDAPIYINDTRRRRLPYRKRLQLVVYNPCIILSFALHEHSS